MRKAGKLLVFNYAMDPNSQVFSHQIEIVELLSLHFDEITVITGTQAHDLSLDNVRVINLDWQVGKTLKNLIRIFKIFPIIKSLSGDYRVFFHMTDVYAAVFSPYFRIARKQQLIWYAHAHKSKYLAWASIWVNYILTSTPGSCPIRGKKIVYLGQGVDHNLFAKIPFEELRLNNMVHYGRFDKSKRIDLVIEGVSSIHRSDPKTSLEIIGTPINRESKLWANEIKSIWRNAVKDGWLTFTPAVKRRDIPRVMRQNGVFVHAFQGSLDKALIESTLLGVPVITLNKEYVEIFGTWSSAKSKSSLEIEYKSMRAHKNEELIFELNRRRLLAIENHSLNQWLDKLIYELKVRA